MRSARFGLATTAAVTSTSSGSGEGAAPLSATVVRTGPTGVGW